MQRSRKPNGRLATNSLFMSINTEISSRAVHLFCRLGPALAALGLSLRSSKTSFRRRELLTMGVLGASWGDAGPSGAPLGPSGTAHGASCGRLEAILGASCAVSDALKARTGVWPASDWASYPAGPLHPSAAAATTGLSGDGDFSVTVLSSATAPKLQENARAARRGVIVRRTEQLELRKSGTDTSWAKLELVSQS